MNFMTPQIKVSTIKITPQMAAQMLLKNTKNRKMNRNHINSMVRDMLAGNWQQNGDAIRFDYNGDLIDGQHRLKAIIESGKAMYCVVVRGLDPESMKTIDSGKKRNYGDRLTMRGIKNANRFGPTINMLSYFCGIKNNDKPNTNMGHGLTPSEMDDIMDAHPLLHRSIEATHKAFPSCENILGALHYIGCYQDNERLADNFVQVWRDGQATYDGDAAVFAREWFIRDNARARRTGLTGRKMIVVNSFNRFMAQQPMKNSKGATSLRVAGFTQTDLFTGKAH
jgi:hypothetical protein